MNKAAQKTALITGAASGLGWELTRRYLSSGYHVLMLDVQEDLLQQRRIEIGPSGSIDTACINIADSAAVAEFCQRYILANSRLDVLINNAGITHRSLAEKTDVAVFRRVMAVDYQGPVELSLQLLPALKACSGTIVNVGSMAGWMPVLGRSGYCAAKSALHQFFETLRCELAETGVHVLMVYPSFLDTPIETNALGHDGQKAKHARSMVGKMRSAEWMANEIFNAQQAHRERLFPDRFTNFASLLYRLWPRLYQRQMRKKFASEMTV